MTKRKHITDKRLLKHLRHCQREWKRLTRRGQNPWARDSRKPKGHGRIRS